MYKLCIVLIVIALLCACAKAPALDERAESSPGLSSPQAAATPLPQDPSPSPSSDSTAPSLEERMASLSFTPVSGQYVRKSIQGDIEYMEMFALDKTSFVRAALSEGEEEVFVYDYQNDRFTYLYLFENEVLSKVVYDMAAQSVLEDEDDLARLLIGDAEALKEYFYKLLETAGIEVEELL